MSVTVPVTFTDAEYRALVTACAKRSAPVMLHALAGHWINQGAPAPRQRCRDGARPYRRVTPTMAAEVLSLHRQHLSAARIAIVVPGAPTEVTIAHWLHRNGHEGVTCTHPDCANTGR